MTSNFKHHAQAEALSKALRDLDTKNKEVQTLEEQIKQRFLIPRGVRLLIPLLSDWSSDELDRLIKACMCIKEERRAHQEATAKKWQAEQDLKAQVRVCVSKGSDAKSIAKALGITQQAASALIALWAL